MKELIILIMNEFGYIGIMILIFIENIFPPIPSEVILTFGGFMTTYSNINVVGVILSSTLGSLIGAIVLYKIGKVLTYERIDRFINSKLNRVLRFKKNDIENSEKWFKRRGKTTVFFCRFIPIVRSLISIPAGMAKMKFYTFIIFSFFGSLIWNIALILLGKFAGESWNIVLSHITNYSNIAMYVLICIIFFVVVYIKIIKRKIILLKIKKTK